MGACLSTKNEPLNAIEAKIKKSAVAEEKFKNQVVVVAEEEPRNLVRKEIFVIRHRPSHDKESSEHNVEEDDVDAILIQCGRLSRNNSSRKVSSRNFSGSKKSYDFDEDGDGVNGGNSICDGDDEEDDEIGSERRERHRQPRRTSRSSSRGRRTPSRERRVSRSPGKRPETALAASSLSVSKPGKMVSVPAVDKGIAGAEGLLVKRITVKRNVGVGETGTTLAGSRCTASPRSRSLAHNWQPLSISRSSSRKAEQSPYRRNPLSEIDNNSVAYAQAVGNNKPVNSDSSGRVQNRAKEFEGQLLAKEAADILSLAQIQKPNADADGRTHIAQRANKVVKERTVIAQASEAEMKPQILTRSRSARRSRDLDLNPETLLNPTSSYTALLLEDIQNFHQKSTNTNTTTNTNMNIPAFSVPPCLAKACSILEAVADLNSTTSSNLSYDDKRITTFTTAAINLVGKKIAEAKDPFIESEVLAIDDLVEPSLCKYVTVRRGNNGSTEDLDGQESSGSNNFVGGLQQQHWEYSKSSRERNSGELTDKWTLRSNARDEDTKRRPGIQRHVLSESGRDTEEATRGLSGQRNNGIGRRRMASSGRNLYTNPIFSADVAST